MKQLLAFCKEHPFFTSYLLVYGLLQIGLISSFGFTYAPALFFLFFIPFTLAYFGLSSVLTTFAVPKIKIPHLPWVLLSLSFLICVTHLFWLGDLPFFKAWQAEFLSEANQVRKMGTAGLPKWLHYASTWALRALLPVSALLFIQKKSKVGFFLSLFIGSFYGLMLLQKSLVLWVNLPILIYFILNRKWISSARIILLTACLFVAAILANNPQLHGGKNDLNQKKEVKSSSQQVSEGLVKRIFIVPGKTLGLWLKHVPKDKPYLYGRDFSLYAKLTKQKVADYNLELYPLFYPDYAQKGINGSVNTAHFMRAYANFGWWSLPFSAMFLALFFQFLNILYRKTEPTMAFSLQLFPLLLLSSGSLLTLLFSGGWGLILTLLLISARKENC
ncbi:MAG: hypothetical protein ACKOWX_09130 [Flavobacteriales bacterium]